MNTCKFFLQGTCKFGDSCKFSHQINETIQSQGTSIMRQNTKPPTIDTNLLVKSVITDMTNAEKGGHWLLSSYAPFKDKPCFPGFEDKSFEEVRCGYYEATKAKTVDHYKQQLQVALQEAAMKMRALQNPSNDIVAMLVQIYNTPVANQNISSAPFSPQPSTFGQNPLPFTQNQQQGTSIFAVANQNLFGNTGSQQKSLFSSTQPSSNLFGGSAQPAMNKSVFGGTPTVFNSPPAFGSTVNSSIFGNKSSPFGAGQSNTFTTQNNAFNQQSNVFSSPIQNSPFQVQPSGDSAFNSPVQASNASIFANQSQQTVFPTTLMQAAPFNAPVQQQSVFMPNTLQPNTLQQSNVQSTSPFQQQPPASSVGTNFFNTPVTSQSLFGGQTSIFSTQSANMVQNQQNLPVTNPAMLGGQTSIFGNQSTGIAQKQESSIFGQNAPINAMLGGAEIDSVAYSKLEDLSESEIKSFQSDSFEFGKIPEKPPTVQMCV